MNKVLRDELLPLAEYETIRTRFRNRVIALKEHRRVLVGAHMSLVFENHDTVLLQVQEMLRTERIIDERAIAHELSTYNELIPAAGSLSATLFIEYDDAAERKHMLERFSSLRDQVFFCVDEHRSVAHFSRHFGEEEERLPAVNYVTFDVGAGAATALTDSSVRASITVTHPDYAVEVDLPRETRRALADDLR
jgi:hypothetical protein